MEPRKLGVVVNVDGGHVRAVGTICRDRGPGAHLVLLGSDVQRSVSVFGGGVRRRAFLQQQQRHVLVVVVAGHVQRGDAVLQNNNSNNNNNNNQNMIRIQ